MRTLRDVRNRLGAVARAVRNRRRRGEAAARGSFADHLLAFPSAIEFEPERAKAAARPLDTPAWNGHAGSSIEGKPDHG